MRLRPLTLPLASLTLALISLVLVLLTRLNLERRNPLREVTDSIIQLSEDADADGIFVIHVPGAGCPTGWLNKPGMFQREDTISPACIIVKGRASNLHLDYLMPGEAILQVPIPVDALPEKEPTI